MWEALRSQRARAFGSLNVLWGHSFAFVGFCHLLVSCRRFLSVLVSLHTFNRLPISRKHRNSQMADLSSPSNGCVTATRVSQCLFHSLQGYSSTVAVTVVYTPRLFAQPTVPAKPRSVARRVFLRMHLETCIGLSQRHVVRWKQLGALQFSWMTKMVSSSSQLPGYTTMFSQSSSDSILQVLLFCFSHFTVKSAT